jgi:hypothetical protein
LMSAPNTVSDTIRTADLQGTLERLDVGPREH